MTAESDTKASDKGIDNRGFSKDFTSSNGFNKGSFQEKSQNGSVRKSEKTYEKEKPPKHEKKEKPVDLSCGIWKFRTNAFGRKFANLYVFTVCVGISMLFTQMVHSVIHVQLTSIERQFNIDNARAGLFDTASKAGHLSTFLLAGHFAKKVHIPVVVGSAGMFQGIILMIPAFMQLADPYTLPLLTGTGDNSSKSPYGDNEKYFCYPNNTNVSIQSTGSGRGKDTGDSRAEANQMAFIVILIVQALKGVTDTFHAGFLPTLYVDDNMLDKTKMGIFFGIKYVLGDLASPVGKQLNAILTEVPIDLKKTQMDPKDRRFVAAWWLAFLIFGAATALFSFPIILFPRKLVSKRQQQEALQRAMVSFAPADHEKKTITDKVKSSDVVRKSSITIVGVKSDVSSSDRAKRSFTPQSSMKKGSFHSHSSSRRFSLFPPVDGPSERKVSIDGSMVFDQPIDKKKPPEESKRKSEIIELIKDFPKAVIRVLKRPVFLLMLVDIAIVSIPMSGTSIFRSIYMTSEYNVAMTEVATLTGVTSAVSHVIGTLVSGVLASRVKSKVGYMWIIFGTYLISICITPLYLILGCDNQHIFGHDGRYGMPANVTDVCGCEETKQLISCGSDGRNYLTPCHAGCLSSVGKVFTNCSGLATLSFNQSMTLVPGLCDTPCHTNFYLYVALHAIQGMFSSMASIPRRLLILRIVDPRDRAFATSLFGFSGTLLAIPSPNLFGRVIDNTCLVKDGNVCSLYDRDRIRYLIAGIDVGVNGIVQITFMLMVCVFKWEERKLKKQQEEQRGGGGGGPGDKEKNAKI